MDLVHERVFRMVIAGPAMEPLVDRVMRCSQMEIVDVFRGLLDVEGFQVPLTARAGFVMQAESRSGTLETAFVHVVVDQPQRGQPLLAINYLPFVVRLSFHHDGLQAVAFLLFGGALRQVVQQLGNFMPRPAVAALVGRNVKDALQSLILFAGIGVRPETYGPIFQ